MAPKGKALTEEEVLRIREAPNYRKLKVELHVSEARVKAIRTAASIGEALSLAGVAPGSEEGQTPNEKSERKETAPAKPPEPGGAIAIASAPRPAAVIFTLGSQKIELEPQKLYEAYLLFLDIKAKMGVTDSFGEVMLDAMGIVWRLMVPEAPQVTSDGNGHGDGIIQAEKQEVRHGSGL